MIMIVLLLLTLTLDLALRDRSDRGSQKSASIRVHQAPLSLGRYGEFRAVYINQRASPHYT